MDPSRPAVPPDGGAQLPLMHLASPPGVQQGLPPHARNQAQWAAPGMMQQPGAEHAQLAGTLHPAAGFPASGELGTSGPLFNQLLVGSQMAAGQPSPVGQHQQVLAGVPRSPMQQAGSAAYAHRPPVQMQPQTYHGYPLQTPQSYGYVAAAAPGSSGAAGGQVGLGMPMMVAAPMAQQQAQGRPMSLTVSAAVRRPTQGTTLWPGAAPAAPLQRGTFVVSDRKVLVEPGQEATTPMYVMLRRWVQNEPGLPLPPAEPHAQRNPPARPPVQEPYFPPAPPRPPPSEPRMDRPPHEELMQGHKQHWRRVRAHHSNLRAQQLAWHQSHLESQMQSWGAPQGTPPPGGARAGVEEPTPTHPPASQPAPALAAAGNGPMEM